MKIDRSIRALVVEDNTLVGEMIQGVLEEIGYSVVGKAADGLQAIKLAQSLTPDVILMDIEMPDMDGIEATRHIYENCPAPIVMVTAHEMPELVKQASEAGAGAYLIKPPNTREMERAITVAMARFEDMMELRRLNAELQARNEDLDAFAHTVAHDLQSSLSLMVGYAETLAQDHSDIPPKELDMYLQLIAQNGRKMSNIIDALLLLAGVRKKKVQPEPLAMAPLVTEALQRLATLVQDYQPEITLPETWPTAWGYGPWVEEVWVNYLSNAIKHGGRPPELTVGATVQPGGMVRFWVRDNGPGLSPEEQSRLFTPFTRLEQARTKGYGLGLSIVRRIVEKLGGEVGVESEGISGQGSVFSFTLPGFDKRPGNS
ncbi:MAG: hybrid sensor histidine kinase/response regulator [Chloroflexota bacterium]